MIGVGIGIPFFRSFGGGIDAQAQAHFNRVIADGGVVPSGLTGVNAFFSAVKAIYGTSDINTAISAAYDPHYLGYKLGAGSGTTLGQAARTLYAPKGIFGGIGTGSAYWEGVGVNGNYVQTPSAAINQITGDIEIVARISISDEVGEKTIISKRSGANASYVLSSTSKLLRFRINTTTYDSNAPHTFAVNEIYWAKVTRQQSNGEIKFFTSLNGTTWTQLGTTIVGITDSIAVNSVPVIVGVLGDLSSFSMKGNIYQATIANSIGGAPVVNFNANQYTGANTWTSTTGEVWTVNSTGAGLADVTQTTAASQPLLLAHTGENYWQGVNVDQNNVVTPDAPANRITGDVDIICYLLHTSNGGFNSIVSKNDGGTNRAYNLTVQTNTPTFYYGAATLNTATATANITSGSSLWLRVTRNATNGEIRFFTSNDASTTNPQSVTWTQLGATISGVTGALNSSGTLPLIVGGYIRTGSGFASSERIFRLTIANSIGGTPVVDFNPSSYNAATSQTQWSSATGEVWSINVGTAATGYKGVLVDRSIVQGDGIDDRLASGALTPVSTFTRYIAANPLQRAGFGVLVSGGNSLNTVFYKDSSAIKIYNTGTGVGALSFTSPSSHILALFTADYNTTSSKAAINNGTDATGTIGDNPSNSMNVFADNGNNGNGLVNTIISCTSVNTPTQKTAIYNYLRSINGNSF